MGKGAQDFVARRPNYWGIDVSDPASLNIATVTWDWIRRLRDTVKMKIVLKGILTREDAKLAADNGIDGIIVSNHGGRVVDSGRATIEVLPEVIEAVGGRMTVMVDSGFRRGTDVVKALAMGAQAVCIGRPYLWGLGAFGQPGVERVLEILRQETRRHAAGRSAFDQASHAGDGAQGLSPTSAIAAVAALKEIRLVCTKQRHFRKSFSRPSG